MKQHMLVTLIARRVEPGLAETELILSGLCRRELIKVPIILNEVFGEKRFLKTQERRLEIQHSKH